MKTFKDFVDEETGAVPGNVTGTGGGSNIGNEPATIGPRGKHPHSDLVRRQNKLRERGVVVPEATKVPNVPVTPPTFMTKEESELFEDDKKEQRKRDSEDKSIPGTKFATSDKNEKKNDPFSSERKSEIKKMTKHIEEERDYEGKLLTPAKKKAGGYWADEGGKPKWIPRAPLSGGFKRLEMSPPKLPSGKSKSQLIPAKEHPDIIASQKKKIQDAEAKKREKEVKDRVQNLKLLRQLEKIQKERGTLHQTLMKKK